MPISWIVWNRERSDGIPGAGEAAKAFSKNAEAIAAPLYAQKPGGGFTVLPQTYPMSVCLVPR